MDIFFLYIAKKNYIEIFQNPHLHIFQIYGQSLPINPNIILSYCIFKKILNLLLDG